MAEKSTPSELLVRFLLGDEETARSAADATSGRALWTNAVRLATHWRVLARLRAQIANLEIPLPPEATAEMSGAAVAATAQSGLVCNASVRAFEALDDAEIAYAAFKGIATIAGLGLGPADRMLNDADVLIHRDDLRRTIDALAACGFTARISVPIDEWVALLDDRVFRGHDFLNVENADGITLDIHWTVGAPRPGGFEGLIARSTSGPLLGRTIAIVSPEDAVLLAVQHSVRDGLAAQTAVKDMADVDAWIGAGPARIDPSVLADRAGETGLDVSLLAVLGVITTLDENGSARELTALIEARLDHESRRAAAMLTEIFFVQLRDGPASEVLLGITGITPAMIGRYLVSRVRMLTDSSYRKDKYQVEGPPPARRQLGDLARDLLRLSPGKLGAYRALARERRRYSGS